MEEQIHSDILRCAFIHQAKIMALWLIPVAVAQRIRGVVIKQPALPLALCAPLSPPQNRSFELSPPFLMTPYKSHRFLRCVSCRLHRGGEKRREEKVREIQQLALHPTPAQPEATPAPRSCYTTIGGKKKHGPQRQVMLPIGSRRSPQTCSGYATGL